MPPMHRGDRRTSRDAARQYDHDRGSASSRLYDSTWAAAAKAFLRLNPLCAYCTLAGHVAAATLVDHFWPHRGDRALFWRREFWVPSCAECHSGMKQATERQGMTALLALAGRLGMGSPQG